MSLQKIGKYIEEFTKKNKNDAPYPVYSVTNSNGFCTDYFSKDVSGQDKTTYKIVPKGYFAYNPSRINVGSIDWQNSEDNVIVSPLYVVFKCSDSLDQDYLKYFLKSSVGVRLINEKTSGSVRNSLKFKELSEFELNIVDVEEQRKIVNTLKLIESAIENEKKQINLYDELVKARFVEMFGDPVDNPMGWEKRQLQCLVSDDCSISYGIVKTGDDVDGGIPVFRPVDIVGRVPKREELKRTTHEISNQYRRSLLTGRDLLVTVRANIADTFIAGQEFKGCNVGRGIVPIRTNESIIHLEFLKAQMDFDSMNRHMKALAKGITLIQLNMEDLRTVEFIVPPIEKQEQYVAIIQQIDKSKFVAKKRLKLYEELLEKKTYDFYIR